MKREIFKESWIAATSIFAPSTIHSSKPVPLPSTTPTMDTAVAMRKTMVVNTRNIPKSFLKTLIFFLPPLASPAKLTTSTTKMMT